MASGRQEATVPGFTPSAYGLLQMAQDMTSEAPEGWENGINYRTLCPEGGRTYSACPPSSDVPQSDTGIPKLTVDQLDLRGATPVTVYERFDCAPVGWAEDGLQDLAERALGRISSYQVELGFATGTAGPANDQVVHPHLQSNTDVTEDIYENDGAILLSEAATVLGPGAAVDPVQAFVNLEAALAQCYKGEGYIHVPAGYGSALVAADLIRLVSGRWRSANNHTVVLGDGYPGDAPDGTDPANPGEAWFYATGQVWYYKSGVRSFTLEQTLDRARNTVHALAERTYLVAYECCLFAQLVQIATA